MLITTTPGIEGKTIKEYRGIVFGEVIDAVYFLKDFAAGLMKFTGGRTREYEEELKNSRADALREMMQRAAEVGANAVIGVDVDYEVLNDSMLLVSASGTAVIIE